MVIFAADIGGTRCRFALVDERQLKVLVKEELETKKVKSLNKEIKKFLERHEAKTTKGTFSVAGPVRKVKGKQHIKMPNSHLIVKERELEKIFKNVTLLNDFEALGYALDLPGILKHLRRRKGEGTRVIIGPGTGLGHSIITPKGEILRCEGDQASMPLITTEEYGLATFIKFSENISEREPITLEQLLSGRGLEYIYEFLRLTQFAREHYLPMKMSAEEISETKKKNRCSKETWNWFARFVARRCRDFSLETYATGGVFLGSGILQKNPDILDAKFLKEFSHHHDKQYQAFLERVPLALIKDPNAGMLGAALALRRKR